MTRIDLEETLAEHVERTPWAARVFEDHGLDFVNLGSVSVEEACTSRDIDTRDLQRELTAIDRRDDASDPVQFSNLTELVDYLEEQHHAFLREELQPLATFVDSLHDRLGSDSSVLRHINEQLEYLVNDLPAHLDREEEILFPAVRALEDNAAPDADPDLAAARELLVGLEEDHQHYEKSLWQIRDVSDNYAMPENLATDDRTRYINMLARLEGLERDMQMHLHRENNVLFRDLRRKTG